jgi:hypothetical protein
VLLESGCTPISLADIEENLESGFYGNHKAFYADVRRIWKNCQVGERGWGLFWVEMSVCLCRCLSLCMCLCFVCECVRVRVCECEFLRGSSEFLRGSRKRDRRPKPPSIGSERDTLTTLTI